MQASELHRRVEQAFNAGDVEALVALYEPDAHMVQDDGTEAVGLEQVRATYGELVALGGTITLKTRHAVEAGDVALLSNAWSLEIDGTTVGSSVTAEVARRGPDGSWRYVIDNPFAQPIEDGTAPA